jgi:hypothetical protein
LKWIISRDVWDDEKLTEVISEGKVRTLGILAALPLLLCMDGLHVLRLIAAHSHSSPPALSLSLMLAVVLSWRGRGERADQQYRKQDARQFGSESSRCFYTPRI